MKKDAIEHTCIMTIVVCIIVSLCGCASYSDYKEYRNDYEEFQEYKKYEQELASDEESVTESAEPVTEPAEPAKETHDINALTEEEITARKSLQEEYVAEREEVYKQPDSYEKTVKINELDKKILENAYYSFTNNKAVFIGDSITEGTGGNTDADGKKISYVNYVDEALNFDMVLNHGKAGRTVTYYGDQELSMDANIDNLINIDCDIVVIYIGVNDYLYYDAEKRFGALDDGSTAGYCGALQSFVVAAERNYPDKEYFFVTMYPFLATDASTYTDYEGTPTYDDYMQIQRTLADRYGYHIIDIYNSGFMSAKDTVTTEKLIPDGIHPNDLGHRMLGEHIAVELLLYYEQHVQ